MSVQLIALPSPFEPTVSAEGPGNFITDWLGSSLIKPIVKFVAPFVGAAIVAFIGYEWLGKERGGMEQAGIVAIGAIAGFIATSFATDYLLDR